VGDGASLVVERHDRHPLAIGVERKLLYDTMRKRDRLLRAAALRGEREQRPFGGIADHLPLLGFSVELELGIRAERGRGEQVVERGRQLLEVLCFARLQVTARVVAFSRDAVAPSRGVHLSHRHLVLRERAGLVGADDACRAERLDGEKLAHDGASFGHPLHAERERDGGDGGQTLGDGGHGEAHRLEKQLVPRASAFDHAPGEEQHADAEARPEDPRAEAVEPLLERGLLFLGLRDHLPDFSELGARSGGDHERAPLAAHDGGAEEHHRAPLGEGSVVGERLARVLDGGGAFARERRLLGGEIDRLHETGVGRYEIARLHLEDVARREIVCVDDRNLAIAAHARGRGRHSLERLERRLGPALLHEAEARVEHDDEQDGERVAEFHEKTLAGVVRETDDHGDDRRRQQREHERVRELPDEAQERALLRRIGEPVRPVLREARRHLVVREPLGRVDAKTREELLHVLGVRGPRCLGGGLDPRGTQIVQRFVRRAREARAREASASLAPVVFASGLAAVRAGALASLRRSWRSASGRTAAVSRSTSVRRSSRAARSSAAFLSNSLRRTKASLATTSSPARTADIARCPHCSAAAVAASASRSRRVCSFRAAAKRPPRGSVILVMVRNYRSTGIA
jgi:hypothetical protein